ncbi:MAG: hypothetical protein R3F61_26370 [Myxococcota bacterium]
MELGAEVAGRVVEEVLAPTLVRARGPGGAVLLRVGPADHAPWARSLLDAGVPDVLDVVAEAERVVVVFADAPGPGLTALLEEHRMRRWFRALASELAGLHERGVVLRGLDPDGLRTGGRLVPMVHDDARWSAPEGPGTAAADWYAFGLLLYWAITGSPAFTDTSERFERNGPDPRDLRAGAPPDLASLAMDLLLRDPDDRPDGEEVLHLLAPTPDRPVVSLEWLDELQRLGGLSVRADIEGAAEHLDDALVELLGAPGLVADDALVERIMAARALTRSERGLAGTVVQRGDVLGGSARVRAGALLGQALATTGVRVLVVHGDPVAEAGLDALEGLLRARPTPAVVVVGTVPPAFLDRVIAAGERVVGDGRSPEALVAALPLEGTGEDGLDGACSTLRMEGRVEPLLESLRELGIPVRSGRLGRGLDALARWRTPGMASVAGDASVARAARRGASHLALVDPEKAVLLGGWTWREAHRAGDLGSAAFSAWAVALGSGVMPDLDHTTLDETGQAGLLLARTALARRDGHWSTVVRLMLGKLPLPGGGAADTALASLLVAESRMQLGQWTEAARWVRRCRVDARKTGNALLELGAVCLGVQIGLPLGSELEALAVRLDPSGVLGWWVACARAHRALLSEGAGAAAALLEAGLAHVPRHPVVPALSAEAQVWTARVRAAAGGPVPTHGSSLRALGTHGADHPARPGWEALGAALRARRAGDVQGMVDALAEAEGRFEGLQAGLMAAACKRQWGLVTGGNKGGNAVTAADKVFRAAGAHPALTVLGLLPELAGPPH